MRKLMILAAVLAIVTTSISTSLAQDADVGTLEFRANGEDFVREGFVSKDGWRIDFDHVYISLAAIRAYQTDPPYDAFAGELTSANQMVGLPGTYTIDLAAGDAEADPILIGAVEEAPGGYYNALSWMMLPADEGVAEGQTIVMEGIAEKEGELISFSIAVDNIYAYTCGAFIGDDRKGVLQAGTTGDIELTFHFDHIFGDSEAAPDDDINVTAPGFDPFAAVTTNGSLDVTLQDLEAEMDSAAYQMFVDILPSLGHVGEGHCHES
jgi:hypothetical protein